ncbi:unnamed protein product [Caenorhabditis brenneri]
MSERFKYAINGEYKWERFEEHLADGQFPDHYIGSVPWGLEFYITLKIREGNNKVYPYIACAEQQKLKIRAFFSINSDSWSLCFKTEGSILLESSAGVSGPSINIQDVLNEDGGYLENGALSIGYGFHVDALLDNYSIWIFNLSNKLFDSERENNTVTIQNRIGRGVCHSPKPLLAFHSSLFPFKPKMNFIQHAEDEFQLENCLQIGNGVRLQYLHYYEFGWFKIAEVGRNMNMMNVVHYCDSMITRASINLLNEPSHLKRAILLNMRQTASHIIQLWKFKELLQEMEDNLDEVPGEMMKVIIRKFINEEF